MLKINLLPPEEKKEIRFKKIDTFILRSFIIFLLTLVISSLLFLFLSQVLSSYVASFSEQINIYENYLAKEKNKEIENKISQINNILSKISLIQKNQTTWSSTLIEITSLVPQEIKLTKIEANKKEKKIEISGWAKTRKKVLDFVDNLEKSEYFENVSLPLSDIVTSENISFNIEAVLTNKALYQNE